MPEANVTLDIKVDTGLDLETRKAIARLRKLLPVNTTRVHLFTRHMDAPGSAPAVRDRWLSDRYVMVKVTGDLTLQAPLCHDDPCLCPAGEWPDGGYKLTAGKGLQPNGDTWLVPDTAGLLNLIESKDGEWHQLHRTKWSVADSPAKLMLAYTKVDGSVQPHAINEGIWDAFEASFPGDTPVLFEAREGDPYRVSQNGEVVGYIARGQFVDPDQRAQAWVVAGAVAGDPDQTVWDYLDMEGNDSE